MDEIQRCLAPLGYLPEEVADAIARLAASTFASGPSGYVFRPDAVPTFLQQALLVTFEGDPRDWPTFVYVHGILSDLAREKGVRNATTSVSSIMARGVAAGYRDDQLVLAIHGLAWMNLASVVGGTVSPTDRTLTTSLAPERRVVHTPISRPQFAHVLKNVREIVEGRSEETQWRRLVRELEMLSRPNHLEAAEERVLDDICAQFADTGEPINLDDALRRMPDLDVRTIVFAKLEPKGYVHARPDTRVLPSLSSLLRGYALFPQLLLTANAALANARAHWERNALRVPLAGAHGLIPVSRPEPSQRLALHQLRLLIEALALGPCLYPAGNDVEIRDAIRLYDTLPKLLGQKLRHGVAERPPKPRLAPYEEFLRAALHVATESAGGNVTLRNLARTAGLRLSDATRLLSHARSDKIVNGANDDALQINVTAVRDAIGRLTNKELAPSNGTSPSSEANPTLLASLTDRLQRWLHVHNDGTQSLPGVFALGTQTGSKRTQNQDRAVFARLMTPKNEPFELAVVCDGIGGLRSGDQGAEIAVAVFVSVVFSHQQTSRPNDILLAAAREANAHVHRALQGRGGTTLSALLTKGDHAYVCNVGDGRVYTVGPDGTPTQVTTDDTMKGRLDALGISRETGALEHERLVQYVGMGEDFRPQITPIELRPATFVLLATDGAYRPSLTLLPDIVRTSTSPDDLVQRLLAISSWTGGNDNATVIALIPPVARTTASEATRHSGALEVWNARARVEFVSVPVVVVGNSAAEPFRRRVRPKRQRQHDGEQLTIVDADRERSASARSGDEESTSDSVANSAESPEVEISVGKRGPEQ